MNKKINKKLLLIGGALVLAAAVFFSTPWPTEPAPYYIPVPDIHIELEKKPSHFPGRMLANVSNTGNQIWGFENHLTLEYFYHGEWYQLGWPFFTPADSHTMEGRGLRPGKSMTLYVCTKPHGYFLKSGHYRAVLEVDSRSLYGVEPSNNYAAFKEFDI